MKTVCDVLGVARSALAVRKARSPDWQDGRRARYIDDTDLVASTIRLVGTKVAKLNK